MSAHLMGLAFKARLGAVNRKIVLLKLCDHAHDDGTSIYPSVARIAWDTEISERTVQRILAGFVESGLLQVAENKKGGRGRTKNYILCVEKLYDLVIEKKGDSLTPFNDGAKPVEKGDSVTPFNAEKGDSVTPFKALKGDKSSIKGDKSALKGDRACHPNPYNHQEPSDSSAQERERVCSESEWFDKFIEAYPRKSGMPIEPARNLFVAEMRAGTNPEMMVEAVRGYALRVKSDGTDERYICNPARFLSEKRFISAPKPAKAGKPIKPKVFVDEGTPAWGAWMTFYKNKRGFGPKTTDLKDPDKPRQKIRRGNWFPSQYPPVTDSAGKQNKTTSAREDAA